MLSIILIILIPTAFFVLNLLFPPAPEPFSLDDAPVEIILIKDDLKTKLTEDTFSWSDMENFITFSQYIADNSPLVAELIQDWDKTVVFNVVGSGYFWFITVDNVVTMELGPTPPSEPEIQIDLNLETMVQILTQTETAISSYQKVLCKHSIFSYP